MRARYVQGHDGEGFTHIEGEKIRIACCDCGLVHDAMLDVVGSPGGQKVRIFAIRNGRATAGRRKNPKIKLLVELEAAQAKVQAVEAWIAANAFVGKSVNASDEELLRDSIADELFRAMEIAP